MAELTIEQPWQYIEPDDTESNSWRSRNTTQSTRTPSTTGTDYSQRYYDTQRYPSDKASQDITYDYEDKYSQTRVLRSPSVGSVASSNTSAEDVPELKHEPRDTPLPAMRAASPAFAPAIIASSSHNFAKHFPSDDRMLIRHDGTTRDGNMNLRLDTMVPAKYGIKRPMTLFHLRMHDLKSREFSLRRYCRDSGREICRIERQYQEAPDNRQNPNLYKALSYAFASLKRQSSGRDNIQPPRSRDEHAQNDTIDDDDDDDDEDYDEEEEVCPAQSRPQKRARRISTNTINLEFSNYAHVDMTRKGRGTKKCYTFEYWGVKYSWRRQMKQQRDDDPYVSYHLFKDNENIPAAHIVPDVLNRYQIIEEQERGGWVPQCSMWIKDLEVIRSRADVADVIVATGLAVLVDDTIKRAWPLHRRQKPSLTIPSMRNSRIINNAPAALPLSPPLTSSSSSSSRPTTAASSRLPSSYYQRYYQPPTQPLTTTTTTTATTTRNLMTSVFRPQAMHTRHNTQPQAAAGFANNPSVRGPYRRRTMT